MPEVNDLFAGWEEHPPTNLLVKAIVEGLGGGAKQRPAVVENIPPGAMAEMQRAALADIARKAGPLLPIMRGTDKTLPKTPPIFDPTTLDRRNAETLVRNARKQRV